MTYFQDLAHSIDPIVSHTACILEETTSQYQSGKLSKEEYIELTNDILDYNTITANMIDLDRRQFIFNAFQELTTIVSEIMKV